MVLQGIYGVSLSYLCIVIVRSILQGRYARRHAAASRLGSVGPALPSVDVVLPCYNEDPALLAACCDSLVAQDYLGELRVFLVDDGSSNLEDLLPIYQRYEVRAGWTVLLLRSNRGKRMAQDAAIRYGSGELVVTVDSDTVFAPSAISRLVSAFADPRVGAVTGDIRVSNAAQNWFTRLIDERYRLLFQHERAAQSWFATVLCCSGEFSAYRRSVLADVWSRYISQTFRGRLANGGDDLHLTNLVLSSGYESHYQPSAKALTNAPATLRRYLGQQLRWYRSFYRELACILPVLVRRPSYLTLDVAAQVLAPMLLPVLIFLVEFQVMKDPISSRSLGAIALIVATGLIGAGLLVRKGASLRFVVLYGLVYVFLLIIVMLMALGTLSDDSWGTRQAADRVAQSV